MSSSIVIIGTGSIAQQHTKNLDKKYTIYSFRESTTSLDELKNFFLSNEISAAIVCSSSASHMKFIKICIECSIPFYTEKPLCLSSEDIKFLDIQKKEVMSNSCIGFNLRYHPALIWLKSKLQEQCYPISFDIRVGHNVSKWRPERKVSEIFSLDRQKGGGAVSELSHECDIVCYLFDKVENWKSFSLADPWRNEVDGQTSILLKMTNAIGSINLDMVSPIFHRQIILSSLNLHLEIDMLEAKISGMIDCKEIDLMFEFDRNATLDESIKTFLNNLELKNARKPLNLYEECRSSSQLVAEIYETISL